MLKPSLTGGEDMGLNDRKKKILAAIVEQYIATGEPIGSKALCKTLDMSVSSATVRNDMSELSELGYLDQPHTSAGRVPTQMGYRYYLDHLMPKHELDDDVRRHIDVSVDHRIGDPEQLLERAGEILVDFTNCASLSTTLADENAVIRKVEIVQISPKTAMIVLLSSTGILKSKVCRTDVEITPDLIETFYSVVNQNFLNKPLADIGTVMIQTVVASLGKKALAMSPLLVSLYDLSISASQSEIILGGQANLLNYREFEQNAGALLEFLHKAEPLNQIISSVKNDFDVLIGHENRYKELENSSMIISRYMIGDRDGGSIGIIGPIRMNYSKLIPSIKYLTDIVGRLLSEVYEEDMPNGK